MTWEILRRQAAEHGPTVDKTDNIEMDVDPSKVALGPKFPAWPAEAKNTRGLKKRHLPAGIGTNLSEEDWIHIRSSFNARPKNGYPETASNFLACAEGAFNVPWCASTCRSTTLP